MIPLARPLVVVSLPRSGSSMVAGLLAAHGVWCGTCRPADKNNPKGYYEHLGIEKLVGKYVGHSVNAGKVPEPPKDWAVHVEETLRADGLQGGQPWLYKCSAVYWKLWQPFDPHWIVVARNLDAVCASGRASGRYGGSPRSVEAHLQAISDVLLQRGATLVDAKRVVFGNYDEIRHMLRRVGISFDRVVANTFVDPTLWHY